MKQISVPSFWRILYVFAFILLGVKGRAVNYTDNGSTSYYHLYANDTLFIKQGTYTGSIETFTPNAVIYVSAGARFHPNDIKNARGNIINYGYCLFDFNFSPNANFRFLNYSILRVTKNCILTTTNDWLNGYGALIEVENLFQINASTFVNSGQINAVRMQVNASSLFTNRNKINTSHYFEVNGGSTFDNLGFIESLGNMSFNQGTYQNNCQLSTEGNFSNSATFINRSIITIKEGKAFDNYGNFSLANNASVKAAKFNNYQAITGSGTIFLTGQTVNYGSIGITGPTTDTIKVFDATRTNAPKFFDTDWGSVRPNVVFRNLLEPDPEQYKLGCAFEFTGIPVAIHWLSFSIQEINDFPNLIWKTPYKAGTTYTVERSYDNQQFRPLATLSETTGNTYTWLDKTAENAVIFYRIKATEASGQISYSEIKKINLNKNTFNSATVFPSPFSSTFTWTYYSQKNNTLNFILRGSSGQTMLMKQTRVSKGQNSINFTGIATLSGGIYSLEVYNENELVATHKLFKR